jgi:hypothetical protein
VAQDPKEFASGDSNLYGYTNENPISNVYPYGLETGAVSLASSPGHACSCPPVPKYPCGRSPQNTLANSTFLDIPELIRNNENRGPYDFKREGIQFDDAGNFNFGLEAASKGIGPIFAHLGAGFYHQYHGAYDPSADGTWWNPLSFGGDSPNGHEQIDNGYQYQGCGC